MFNFFKKLFKKKQKQEEISEADIRFNYIKEKLLNPKTDSVVIPGLADKVAMDFTVPATPEDDLSEINFSGLPKELRIKIKQLVKESQTPIEV